MESAEVVVVGGGAAGLAAFQALRAAGREALLVEARERLGGRIHTLHPEGWPLPVELGAEFIHGPADGLGIEVAPSRPGRDWSSRGGKLHVAGEFAAGADAIFARMAAWHGPDLSFSAFLETCGDLDPAARAGAAAFIEGYEAADPARISIAALNREFAAEGDGGGPFPHRPLEGYDRLLTKLHTDGRVHLHWPVESVAWRRGAVRLTGPGGETIEVRRAIITLPVSLLQQGSPTFYPPLDAKRAALDRLAMGGALRITLRLRRAFWQDLRDHDGEPLAGLRFLFGETSPAGHFPTWWTSTSAGHARGPRRWHSGPSRCGRLRTSRSGGPPPASNEARTRPGWGSWGPQPGRASSGSPGAAGRGPAPVNAQVVGWAGGRHAGALSGHSPAALAQRATADLAACLGIPTEAVAREIVATHIHDWQSDPFSQGAYSYATVGGADAFAALALPLDDTLFFAGEATDSTGRNATVPGAVASGRRAASELLALSPMRPSD